MDITPVLSEDRQRIVAYGGGRFVVNGKEYPQSLFLTRTQVQPWPAGDAAAITYENLKSFLREPIEILLIGTGNTQRFLAPDVRQQIKAACGGAVEIMDTGAACRTFNVLVAEDRHVAAALIAV